VDFSGHSRFACGPFSPPADLVPLLAWHTWAVFYQTYGPLPAACEPFSFSRTFCMLCVDLCFSLPDRFNSSARPSGPFWSLVLRVRTILSLAWHTWSLFYQTYGPLPAACGPFSFYRTFYMLWVNLCPSLADRFHSSGPPKWTFLATCASRADHSLAYVAHVISIL
jgi:hypothetical protein